MHEKEQGCGQCDFQLEIIMNKQYDCYTRTAACIKLCDDLAYLSVIGSQSQHSRLKLELLGARLTPPQSKCEEFVLSREKPQTLASSSNYEKLPCTKNGKLPPVSASWLQI